MVQVAGREVGPVGYGMMGLTWRTHPPPLEQALDALKAALNNGCTLWNGADFYGTPEYNSLTVLKHYFTKYPEDADKVTLIIKGGHNPETHQLDGSPEGVRLSVDSILEQLGGVKKLDAWAPGRRDQSVPFEVTLKTLKEEYIDTGKIGGFSLSECRAETIHEAVKHVKVVVAEVELSMFTPDILNNGVAAACAQYGIPIIGYSPQGRGLLTGTMTEAAQFKAQGLPGMLPRFQEDTIQHNLQLVKQVQELAEKKGCKPGQLAISWVKALGDRDGAPVIIPLPGATTAARIDENSKLVELTEEDMKAISEIVDNFTPAGGRYPEGAPSNT